MNVIQKKKKIAFYDIKDIRCQRCNATVREIYKEKLTFDYTEENNAHSIVHMLCERCDVVFRILQAHDYFLLTEELTNYVEEILNLPLDEQKRRLNSLKSRLEPDAWKAIYICVLFEVRDW